MNCHAPAGCAVPWATARIPLTSRDFPLLLHSLETCTSQTVALTDKRLCFAELNTNSFSAFWNNCPQLPHRDSLPSILAFVKGVAATLTSALVLQNYLQVVLSHHFLSNSIILKRFLDMVHYGTNLRGELCSSVFRPSATKSGRPY